MEPVRFLLIKDPAQVRRLCVARERDNMRFRAALKGGLCSEEELDERFHRLHTELAAQIDCTECAQCCSEFQTAVDEDEQLKMARKLGQTAEEFAAAHMEPARLPTDLVVKAPCPMLEGKRCAIYDQRPEECRSYPHLHKPEMWSRLLGVVSNAETCPIVFNVVERLKHELGWRSR
ncbi:MAG: YkgJ family cysteine cluster protein [Myxococcales bacterium]